MIIAMLRVAIRAVNLGVMTTATPITTQAGALMETTITRITAGSQAIVNPADRNGRSKGNAS